MEATLRQTYQISVPQSARRPSLVAVASLAGGDLAALDADQWHKLSANAADCNPFYGRQYLLAGLETIDRPVGLRALAMDRPDAGVVGLFPYHSSRIGPFTYACGASNAYQFNGTPLVDRRHASEVIQAFCDTLAGSRFVSPYWLLKDIDLQSRFAHLLGACATRAGLKIGAVRRYARPTLTPIEGGFATHVETVFSKRRLKDIQRNFRRLREAGTVRFERTSEPQGVLRRLDDFMRIEKAGWKGRAGTAFLCDPQHAAFARKGFGGQPGREGLATADSLLLDDQPIAVSLNISAGRTAFTPKCTYDENYRRFSPGLLLEYMVIEAFYAEGRWDDMDAATVADGHVIDGFWNGSKEMADLMIVPDTIIGRAVLQALQARRSLVDRLKAYRAK